MTTTHNRRLHRTYDPNELEMDQENVVVNQRYHDAYRIVKPSGLSIFLSIVLICAFIGVISYGFKNVVSPEMQQQLISGLKSLNPIQNIAKVLSVPCIGAPEISLTSGIPSLIPELKDVPQRFCVQKTAWNDFLVKPVTDDKGIKYVGGFEWLAKMIAFPNHPEMLDNVQYALMTVHDSNISTIGWIEIPAYQIVITVTPGSAGVSQDQLSNTYIQPGYLIPNSGPIPSDTLTPFQPFVPTPSAMPTIAVAEIPTLIPQTPMPVIATQVGAGQSITLEPSEQAQKTLIAPTTQAAILDALSQSCVTIIGSQDFWSLGSVLNNRKFFEFRSSEHGITAYSERVGGNGVDANKSWICVRQVLNWPGLQLRWSAPFVASGTWTGDQIRVKPLYGYGDGVNNGIECALNGIWLFKCYVQYPVGTSTPTPKPIPTWTPRADVPLSQMVTLFKTNGWSTSTACSINGNTVMIGIGGCYTDHPSYLVDFSDVISMFQGGTIKIGPCVQMDDPKINYNNSGICITPFK
jgi:hypothetical protein